MRLLKATPTISEARCQQARHPQRQGEQRQVTFGSTGDSLQALHRLSMAPSERWHQEWLKASTPKALL